MTSAKPIRTILLSIALALLVSTLAHAQYSGYEPPRWHVTGFAGISITHTTQSMVGQKTEAGQLFPVGDFRLNSDGFLFDPRFLRLNAGFNFQKGANTSDRGDLSTGGINLALGGVFLPKSHVPLRASYTKNNHGVSGLGLDQTDDNSRLDVQWDMLFPSLPRITASFQEYGSAVHVPTSFADRTYDEKAFNLGISDFWKDWHWAGNFSVGEGNSAGVSQISQDSLFDNSTRAAGFNLNRTFWDNKARLLFDNREVWRHDHLGGDGTSDNSEFTNNVTFNVQLSPRVSLDAGYAFTQVDFEGAGFGNVVVPGGGPIQVLSLVSSVSHAVSGRVGYRLFEGLRLTQEVRTIRSTPVTGVLESRTSFTETASTVSAERRWHHFDLMGAYTGRFQLAGTTLARSPNSWSNSFLGRIGWGNVRSVRLTGSAQDTRLNLVEQIGGFTAEKRVGVEAETHIVKYFRLRGGAEYSQVDLLNVSGNTRSKSTTYSIQADQRLFSLAFTSSFMDGAGALFPLGLIDRQFLVIPLPISQLLATPLLDRTTHSQGLSIIGRPERRLDVLFSWRKEDTQLVASDQTYNYLQASARYRLGRFSLEGGYSRNINNVIVITGLTGNRLAMWYLRIGRDFRIF
ncbi:MAG: hypothetical protein LAN61_15690 [Acidobacteriia bacterium]|nr:hypothetical protein [Terriglobia bacterium]